MTFALEASRAVKPYFFEAPYPPSDVRVPAPFQLAGAEYALSRQNAIIGDPPGVGKTAQGILVSNALGAKSTLVICPASLRLNWEREVWMWSTLPNVTTYPVLKSADGISYNHNYAIISYDLLRNPSIMAAILGKKWDHVILDEAHYIKDPKGNARTVPICAPDGIPSVAGRFTLLTGTLLPNQPIEAYNAFRLLDWDAIDRASLDDFREQYYDFGEGWITKRRWNEAHKKFEFKQEWSTRVRNVPKNLDDFQRRLRTRLMVRRLRETVLPQLPARRWHLFPLEVSKDIREALKHPGWVAAKRFYEMDPSGFNSAVKIDGAISSARLALGIAKAPGVTDYCEELIEEGRSKLVVGAWHHEVLNYMRDRLEKYGLCYMDGGTSPKRKDAQVQEFRDNPEIRIMLGQTQPLGEGWNLEVAQDVVNAEPDWRPGVNEQLFDRVCRRGQKGAYVLGHLPVVPGSLDERIVGRAIEKDQVTYEALDAT